MNLTEIFIRRPVLATVLNLFLLLAGYQAIKALNIRQYPETKNAVITVSTTYSGASADLVRGFITTPLEQEIASADGIDFLQSTSSNSMSTIKAQLRMNYDPNDALTQITSKVNKVRNELPPEAESPIFEVAIGETMAAMYMRFDSLDMEPNQITDYLIRVVQPKFATVPGVQKAEILGARTFAIRIWLKTDKMASLGLSPTQVWGMIGRQSTLAAVGRTKGAMISVNLTADTDLRSVQEFQNMVVLTREGTQVLLKDIAEVTLGADYYDMELKFNGRNTIGMSISVLPTANSIDVVKNVRAMLPDIEKQLPKGMSLGVMYDATEFINESINEVIITLLESSLIVIVVVFLFLGSLRSVFIPIVAIPLSIVGACAIMLVLGFSINLLTLLAMVLAIGLVVDDAIVVVENIHRHIEEGLSPLDAAIKGAHELVSPVIAMTITLAAVYAPIGFQSGITGALFREFAFTLAGSVVISGFVALTLSPMLSSKMLKHTVNPKGLAAFLDRMFNKLSDAYEHLLDKALNARIALYALAALVLASLGVFFMGTPSELAPPEDKGFIISMLNGSPNSTLDQTRRHADEIYKVIEKIPESDMAFIVLGFDPSSGGANPSGGFCGWMLKNWSDRSRGTAEVLAQYQAQVSSIAGLQIAAFLPPSLPGAPAGLPVQFVICSTEDHARIFEVANNLIMRAMQSGMFLYADSDLKFDQPQTDIHIDRQKAADLGIPMQQISGDLASMLSGAYVGRFALDGRAYKIMPQVSRQHRLNPEQLGDYYISNAKGELLPLSTIATMSSSVQPRTLSRFQQMNAATVSLLPAPGVTMGQALNWLNAEADKVLPSGYSRDYSGELRQFVQEGSSLMKVFLLAIIIIYLVLCAQYESFRDPLIIMMSVPLSIAGAMAFLYLGFDTLNIYTQVGLITLVGLITKHGILIVEFANKTQETLGYDVRRAVEHAASVRLRPILMTTAAMVFGVFPLVIAKGAGAESRYSIGLIIATGMSIGTLFTLFIVPAFYVLLAKDRRPAAQQAAPEAAHGHAPTSH